jgi:amidohydrolase
MDRMFTDKYESYVIKLRREFHEKPELSGEEKNTSQRIIRELKSMGIPYEIVGKYGIIATLDGNREGKTLALRADMDALPIKESSRNLVKEKIVVSKIDGAAHVCGHDAHMSMLLGAIKSLAEIRNDLPGRVLFCFEQGEENGYGIQDMLQGLEGKRIDGVWGIHMCPDLPTGALSVESGNRMSSAAGFNVTIMGKGGHASRPDLCIDPIECTAHVILGLSSILSREIKPSEAGVVTIGKLRAGDVGNVLPETAEFSGTIRFFSSEVGNKIKEAFTRIVNNTAAAHGCRAKIEFRGAQPAVAVVNDSKLSILAANVVKKAVGSKYLMTHEPFMASDSMSRYLNKYSGVYAFLGINNEELGTGASLHNPNFDIDEACLKNGVAATVQFTLDFLKS